VRLSGLGAGFGEECFEVECLSDLSVRLFVRGCWMLDGLFPTAARAAYRPGMLPLKLERKAFLCQPSEIRAQGRHGMRVPRVALPDR